MLMSFSSLSLQLLCNNGRFHAERKRYSTATVDLLLCKVFSKTLLTHTPVSLTSNPNFSAYFQVRSGLKMYIDIS